MKMDNVFKLPLIVTNHAGYCFDSVIELTDQEGDTCVYLSDNIKPSEVVHIKSAINNYDQMVKLLELAIHYIDEDSIEDFVYHYQEIKTLLTQTKGIE